MELLEFGTLSPEEMVARVEVVGEERCRAAYAQRKGVLFVTGHFGFWELQALVHAVRMEPIAVLARALDNPELNRLLEQIRGRTGNTIIYRKETIRRVLRQLQAGRGVAVLIDQHTLSRDAIYVDFFEKPAATDVGGCRAGAAHRRADIAGVRAAASRRPLSHDLRARGRAASTRSS